jgi:2'-5' RNA ligase
VSGASGADAARRLFLAIDCDDAARAAIAREQARLRRALDGGSAIRWVKPAQMHLTLVFLGRVAEPRVPALVDACAESIAYPPFTLVFGGLGAFPARGAPRVLWIGAREGNSAAERVQRLVADRVEALGLRTDRRTYHPHLTLGRWRDASRGELARVRALDDHEPVARIQATEVILYESRLSPAGSSYTALARAKLARPV